MIDREHSSRRSIVEELHLRRWPAIAAPAQIVQQLRLVSANERGAEAAVLTELEATATSVSGEGRRHLSGSWASGSSFAWERHTEASAFTCFASYDGFAGKEAAKDADTQSLAWESRWPGEILRATRIYVLESEREAEAVVAQLSFKTSELVSCYLYDGIRIWSDFQIGEDGFGRLVVAASGAAASDLARVIQRLQELGNYRNLALLGLPVAQEHWRSLDRLEESLATFANHVNSSDMADDELLERVGLISAKLMTISAQVRYRISATQAYAQLVQERLDDLSPQKIKGYQSLLEFTQRRLLPAVRTCAVHAKREADLLAATTHFTSLLRARIETKIENQNARVLESLNRSSARQVRLQQLVEGLSIVALSYYAVGLISYVIKGVEAVRPDFPGPESLSVAALLFLTVIGFSLKTMKKRLFNENVE